MCNHSYNNFITHPVAQELWSCLQHLTELRLQFTNPVGSLWKQLSDGRTEAFQILNCFCQEWWLGNRYLLPLGNQVCFSFRSCWLHKSHQLGQRLVIINQSSVMLMVTHSYKCHDCSALSLWWNNIVWESRSMQRDQTRSQISDEILEQNLETVTETDAIAMVEIVVKLVGHLFI